MQIIHISAQDKNTQFKVDFTDTIIHFGGVVIADGHYQHFEHGIMQYYIILPLMIILFSILDQNVFSF